MTQIVVRLYGYTEDGTDYVRDKKEDARFTFEVRMNPSAIGSVSLAGLNGNNYDVYMIDPTIDP